MSGNSVNQSSGCFNVILRRLLCNGSVPTHPSDQISETNTTQLTNSPKEPNFEPKIQSLPSVTPGIVARLMGLDSLPDTNWVSKKGVPDLVKRSRSVSFADYLMDFDLNHEQQDHHRHRRVRTSVSFREVPAVLNHQQQNRDFLVVYLENVDKSKEAGGIGKVKKSEVGFGEVKPGKKKEQRSKNKENFKRERDEFMKKKVKKEEEEKIVVLKHNKKICKLKDEPRREFIAKNSKKSCKNGGANLKKDGENHEVKKKTTQKKKVVVEPRMKKKIHQNAAAEEKEAAEFHGSENSSPLSVFDIDDILIQHETWLSDYSIPMDLNPKFKSSPNPIVSYNETPEMRAAKRKGFEPINDGETRDYAEVLAGKLQKWAGEDLNESNWGAKNVVKFEDFEEICVEFEGLILDMLLQQAIDEFVQISYENLWTCNA